MNALSIAALVVGLLLSVLNVINVSIILRDKAKEPAVKMRDEIENLKRENDARKQEIDELKSSRSIESERTNELEERQELYCRASARYLPMASMATI
jgi:cell division protein FtsB